MRAMILTVLAVGLLDAAAAKLAAQPFPTYRGDRYYEDNYYSREPRRGYTGWAGPPLLGQFCDYRRYPVRECDNGRCRVVGWRLQQYCY